MEKQNYKNENIETKYLKVKNGLLELEKDFIELSYLELRDRVVKIKREIEDMDRLEKEEMKKKRPIKNTWYIPEHIIKSVNFLKDKIMSL